MKVDGLTVGCKVEMVGVAVGVYAVFMFNESVKS